MEPMCSMKCVAEYIPFKILPNTAKPLDLRLTYRLSGRAIPLFLFEIRLIANISLNKEIMQWSDTQLKN